MSKTQGEECKSVGSKKDNPRLKAILEEEKCFNGKVQPCGERFAEIEGPVTAEKACQTTNDIYNYKVHGKGEDIIVTPYFPELRKYHWSFNISDSKFTTYRFDEKYSSVMTVWEIKVRLRHLENVDIEPSDQTLIYRGRLLDNDELLKDIIVNDGRDDIKMHLVDTSAICKMDVNDMLECPENMNFNFDFISESDIDTAMDV